MTTRRTAVSACTIGPMRAQSGRHRDARGTRGTRGAGHRAPHCSPLQPSCWAAVTHRIARRRLADMNRPAPGRCHHGPGPATTPQPPSAVPGGMANRLRATSALLTGQYARTLHLLDQPGATRSTATEPRRTSDLMLRGAALIGLGRYVDATAVLGDDPTTAIARHQRAQVAIETGDDAVALRLLAEPDTDPDEEAGRRRILGELHIRRQRLAEGEALVREAQRLYLGSSMAGREVDAGYCELHLGQAALSRGDGDQAVRRITAAREMLHGPAGQRPGDRAGRAEPRGGARHGRVTSAQPTRPSPQRGSTPSAWGHRLSTQPSNGRPAWSASTCRDPMRGLTCSLPGRCTRRLGEAPARRRHRRRCSTVLPTQD